MTTSSIVIEPAKVSYNLFIGILWGGFALATIFIAFRTFVRIRTFRRLYVDDGFVFLAWTMLLAITITWQVLASDMYLDNDVATGKLFPPPADFAPRVEKFFRASVAIIFLFYSTLWSIKLSFLFFFRRLYMNIGKLMRLWWAVLALTVATWFVCIGTIEYNCLVPSLLEIEANCSSPYAVNFQRTTLQVNCVTDVVTDALLISIPMSMLWKVRISMRRKLALAGIFSLTAITIAFSIIRVAVISSLTEQPDMSWLYMWSNIEMFAALTVVSLGSFRTLFRSQDSGRKLARHESTTEVPTPLSPPRKRLMRNLTDFISGKESWRRGKEDEDGRSFIPAGSSLS
ncbi:hypothetical protein K490DRAFT_71845 [Saccharata proteae CBS 121410]|uniref:Rhodopsin domain-containing protein n=1 Tax=Saccharata proteae CBS 121410 TaxID=1314787 RepID=A0A9P4I1L1_9PEZI|nr:hypothetical protein K490DRAFT_71845 [Saccharata proteae CBS 121410]